MQMKLAALSNNTTLKSDHQAFPEWDQSLPIPSTISPYNLWRSHRHMQRSMLQPGAKAEGCRSKTERQEAICFKASRLQGERDHQAFLRSLLVMSTFQ